MRLRTLLALGTIAAPALASALPPQSVATVRGTYRVRAVARVAGVPLLRELELRGDVVLASGGAEREVQVRVASRGHTCTLAARVQPDGGLELAPGQRCPLTIDEPGTKGAVMATLSSGRGRVADRRIELQLRLALQGRVLVTAGPIPGFGGETELPVSGEAVVEAEGTRDDSRATQHAP